MARGEGTQRPIRRRKSAAFSENADSRRDRARGMRFRWGTTDLVLLSVPLAERAPTLGPLVRTTMQLSPAEFTVVELAARGYSNAEIAQRRATAISTIKKQLETAYRKLGVGSRAELVSLLARGALDGR